MSASSVEEPAPAPEPELVAHVTLETPYKMEKRVDEPTEALWLAAFRERRLWNTGGLGDLVAEQPAVDGHPDPRVIVNVVKVEGPHDKDKLERAMRKHHWINVVECYRLAYLEPQLEGWTHAVVTLSTGGRALRPKVTKTDLENEDVAKCVADKLRLLELPRAKASSRAWVDIRVGPGDEPVPPPEDLLLPGDGELPVAEMQKGAEAGLPAFEACYRAAFGYAPALWGRILIRFHLTEKGRVDEAFEDKETMFPDARVRQCVIREARKLSFARPKKGDLRFMVPLRLWSSRSSIPAP